MIFGKYNLGNFLINDFQVKLLDDAVSNLKKEITSIDKDLKALYSNYDDFIDEVEKKKFGNTSHGEALIKLN